MGGPGDFLPASAIGRGSSRANGDPLKRIE